ncbi:hypothetical protein CWI36_0369p0010 [Hamiltosporidium magnivora]|uniref:Uncharacterized protein n=1 Tax=Hamiltosporidium magnivora TaxID=148818 RepID=A0A4Q9LFP4_9MICR|nr:hypothetical protein CWI36_0369p0010 [Hamiltosporidium magnivora]
MKFFKINTFLIQIDQTYFSKTLLNFFDEIKPNKLERFIIVDQSLIKSALKAFLKTGYFFISEFVKIYFNLTVNEIRLILKNSENIRRLHIISDEASYDVLFELYTYVLTNKKIFIKYKGKILKINSQKEKHFRNLPQNLIFYAKNPNYSEESYKYSYLYSLKTHGIKEYESILAHCINFKNIQVSTFPDTDVIKIGKKILKFIEKIVSLVSITFHQVIFTENEIKFLLKSEKITFLKLNNVDLSRIKYSKYKIHNSSLRGLTMSHCNEIFKLEFLYFLSFLEILFF